jgi:RNA polymerase sigma factor (sigma-70 family)
MEQQFDSLDSYITLAKKIISKFAPTFYNGLHIASALITADWKWDKDRVGFNGKGKTRYSYRNQCAIWAIKTYISNKYKKKNNTLSIDNITDDIKTFAGTLADSSVSDPSEILSTQEEQENLQQTVSELLDSDLLSEKQRHQIYQYYFENKTLLEIGKSYGVTREAIRQNIQKGLNNIKKYAQIS